MIHHPEEQRDAHRNILACDEFRKLREERGVTTDEQANVLAWDVVFEVRFWSSRDVWQRPDEAVRFARNAWGL